MEGCLIGALSLAAYTIGRAFFDPDPASPLVGRTMAFAVLSLAQVAHTFNMRSEGSIFCGRHKGSRLLPAALACAALQCAVILFPPLSGLFKTVPLSGAQWGVVALLALTPIAVVELEKLLARLFGRRKKA